MRNLNKTRAGVIATSTIAACGLLAAALTPAVSQAKIVLYEEGDASLAIAGRIQPRYTYVFPDAKGAEGSDDFSLRRMRLSILATVTEGIIGEWQFDLAGSEVDIKDAYIAYTALPIGDITVGNHYVPFAREVLTSSKRQHFPQRTFLGDHDYGVPDRQMGLSLSGSQSLGSDLAVQYAFGYYKGGIDAAAGKLDFDTVLFEEETEYEGNLFGGRLDFFPFGTFDAYAEGDFERSGLRVAIGANAFTWHNDDDEFEDPFTGDPSTGSDYEEVTGLGIDTAIKIAGLSLGAGYQVYIAETVNSDFDGTPVDFIENGEGDFSAWAVEAGYMIPVGADFVELAVGYEVLNVDAIAHKDRRLILGVNYFFNRHASKIQLAYEMGWNVIDTDGFVDDGNSAIGEDQNRILLQFQQVF